MYPNVTEYCNGVTCMYSVTAMISVMVMFLIINVSFHS